MPKIAVLTFPGNNCETETLRALVSAGFDAEIFLWNRNENDLEHFDGVVIPGGFSFEDRGRSGIVAAQENVLKKLQTLAENGMPVLGICNGAQIVVESGLLLNDDNGIPAVALSRNERKNEEGKILGTGFYHSHRTLNVENKNTPFSHFSGEMIMPIAHGEGRFVIAEPLQEYAKNLIVFSYINENGEKDPHYPTNPNGSFENAAAMCSPKGNVVACMPHPERSVEGKKVFQSFFQFFQSPWNLLEFAPPPFSFEKRTPKANEKADISLFVRLKITDNTEKTFENVLKKKEGENFSLKRREKWDLTLEKKLSLEEKKTFITELVSSLSILNAQKESLVVEMEGNFFEYLSSQKTWKELEKPPFSAEIFAVKEKKDFRGESKKSELSHLFSHIGVNRVSHSVVWEFFGSSAENFWNNPLFAGFVAEELMKIS